MNDIETLNVDELFCIVGFPNVSKFGDVVDPIMSGESVKNFLDRLKQTDFQSRSGRHHSRDITSNAIMTQQMMPSISSINNSTPDDSHSDGNVDDLHLYEFKNVFLEKKERLVLPIFDVEVPYKDVYHCKITTSQSGYRSSENDEKNQYEEVKSN